MRAVPLLVLAGCWRPPQAPPPLVLPPEPGLARSARALEPITAEVGTFDEDTQELTRTTRIELAAGTMFGWRIKLACTGPVEFHETLKTPVPAEGWPEDIPEITISADRTTATTHSYAPCIAGAIENRWTVADTDPPGIYVFTVNVPGYTTQTFKVTFSATP